MLKLPVLLMTLIFVLQSIVVHAQQDPTTAGSFSTQSCQKFINQGSAGAINKAYLFGLRQRAGAWGQDKTGNISNNSVELAFEYFALQSIADYPLPGLLQRLLAIVGFPRTPTINYDPNRLPKTKSFPSPERAAATGNTLRNVEPDGLGTSSITVIERTSPTRISTARFMVPDGVFYEAKTSQGAPLLLQDGSGNVTGFDGSYQILGFIDALDILVKERLVGVNQSLQSRNFVQRVQRTDVTAPLYFLSPSSTRLSQEVINKATERNVLLLRSVSCEYESLGGVLGQSELAMGEAIPLNLNALSTTTNPAFLSGIAGKPGTVVRVVTPPDGGGGGYN